MKHKTEDITYFTYQCFPKSEFPYRLKALYKYQLPNSWPGRDEPVTARGTILTKEHLLIFSTGYTWNGADASPDTTRIIRASLVHDALCEMIAEGDLPSTPYRKLADQAFYQICREDGMGWYAASTAYYAVRGYALLIKPLMAWWNK